jgi:hypothetical protein
MPLVGSLFQTQGQHVCPTFKGKMSKNNLLKHLKMGLTAVLKYPPASNQCEATSQKSADLQKSKIFAMMMCKFKCSFSFWGEECSDSSHFLVMISQR